MRGVREEQGEQERSKGSERGARGEPEGSEQSQRTQAGSKVSELARNLAPQIGGGHCTKHSIIASEREQEGSKTQ